MRVTSFIIFSPALELALPHPLAVGEGVELPAGHPEGQAWLEVALLQNVLPHFQRQPPEPIVRSFHFFRREQGQLREDVTGGHSRQTKKIRKEKV